MSKHTPGPWRAVDGRYAGVGIAHMEDGNYRPPYKVSAIVAEDRMVDRGWRYVAVINGKSTGEIDDDARLIAASPELYEKGSKLADIAEAYARRGDDAVPERLRNVTDADLADAIYAFRAALAKVDAP